MNLKIENNKKTVACCVSTVYSQCHHFHVTSAFRSLIALHLSHSNVSCVVRLHFFLSFFFSLFHSFQCPMHRMFVHCTHAFMLIMRFLCLFFSLNCVRVVSNLTKLECNRFEFSFFANCLSIFQSVFFSLFRVLVVLFVLFQLSSPKQCAVPR